MTSKKKPLVEKTCSICYTIFKTTYSKKKFCSTKCSHKGRYQRTQEKRDYYGYDRDYALRYNYGISEKEYQEMYLKQNGLCAICHKPETKVKKATGRVFSLSVDHCHNTGRIRGLLCKRCNLILGRFNDDTSILENCIEYLNKGD